MHQLHIRPLPGFEKCVTGMTTRPRCPQLSMSTSAAGYSPCLKSKELCVTKQAVSWKLHSAEAIEWGAEYRRINEMKQCRPLSVWLLKPLAGCCLADVTSSHWSLALPLYRSVAFTLCRNVSLNKLSHAHRLSSQDVILCWEDVWNASHSLTATSPISFQTHCLFQCTVENEWKSAV